MVEDVVGVRDEEVEDAAEDEDDEVSSETRLQRVEDGEYGGDKMRGVAFEVYPNEAEEAGEEE